ncbi:hypothetical protein EXIGLDRAFT_725555 [Exidia glandulosa HHB12029]|uniref:Uncharacterized protein n=1 Tax=Exidia glandulosa HHB12029 TaxID=1314781 RepID=A0A165DZM0_EXIGL|nr:hypothetical protein EXIGLDRAFT_725555 [Exidia glandulosa HHB12029]
MPTVSAIRLVLAPLAVSRLDRLFKLTASLSYCRVREISRQPLTLFSLSRFRTPCSIRLLLCLTNWPLWTRYHSLHFVRYLVLGYL